MKATATISSNNGHTVLPSAVRRFLGVGKGARIEFESRANGEVVVRPQAPLASLFGSLPAEGGPSADESARGWHARAERVMKKGRA